MAKQLKVGDIVKCKSDYYSSQLNIGENLGIVVEVRRKNSKILFSDMDRSFWLPHQSLKVTGDASEGRTVRHKISKLLHLLNASDCEVEKGTQNGNHTLSVFHRSIDYKLIDEIKDYLAKDFIDLKILPHGFGEVETQIEFK